MYTLIHVRFMNQDTEVLILAGGKGTRLASVVSDVPKPMALIGETPFFGMSH